MFIVQIIRGGFKVSIQMLAYLRNRIFLFQPKQIKSILGILSTCKRISGSIAILITSKEVVLTLVSTEKKKLEPS